eukprot:1515610-Pleurochrysis_carterae.AAC.1
MVLSGGSMAGGGMLFVRFNSGPLAVSASTLRWRLPLKSSQSSVGDGCMELFATPPGLENFKGERLKELTSSTGFKSKVRGMIGSSSPVSVTSAWRLCAALLPSFCGHDGTCRSRGASLDFGPGRGESTSFDSCKCRIDLLKVAAPESSESCPVEWHAEPPEKKRTGRCGASGGRRGVFSIDM